MTISPNTNQSLLAQQIIAENFTPKLSAKIVTGSTSSGITFAPLTGTTRTTFKITNKGTKGAYLGWGSGTATAIASSATVVAANCDYIGAGAILTQDFQVSAAGNTGVVDTIAAIEGPDSEDNGTTTLEITIGFGQ
jgi:hypothetical protein